MRSVLEREVLRRKMADAADRYADFLREHGEERAWLEEWNAADLVCPPKRRRR